MRVIDQHACCLPSPAVSWYGRVAFTPFPSPSPCIDIAFELDRLGEGEALGGWVRSSLHPRRAPKMGTWGWPTSKAAQQEPQDDEPAARSDAAAPSRATGADGRVESDATTTANDATGEGGLERKESGVELLDLETVRAKLKGGYASRAIRDRVKTAVWDLWRRAPLDARPNLTGQWFALDRGSRVRA